MKAREILGNPEARAGYDGQYQDYWNHNWTLASEATHSTAFSEDADTRKKILSLLYLQRRRDMRMPGLGEYERARLLRIPVELVEFPLWYLREKTLVMRLDTGQLAISALGVDEIERGQLHLNGERLLASCGGASSRAGEGAPAAEISGNLEAYTQSS